MKTIVYAMLCLFVPMFVAGQQENTGITQNEETTPTYTGVENVVNVLNNNDQSIESYLCSELRKEDLVLVTRESGTEVIKFTVDEKGRINNIEVINSVCPVIDEELVDILKTTDGMWRPAMKNGKPVAMEREIKLAFVCNEMKNCGEYMMLQARKNFEKGNQLMMVKNNPKRALKYYEASVKYCPYQTGSLLLRGLCRYENGDTDGALADWKRINELGEIDVTEYINNLLVYQGYIGEFEGYAEMVKVLKKQ